MQQKLKDLYQLFQDKAAQAADEKQLDALRIEYLGRQGIIAGLMTELKAMPTEDKRTHGPLLNSFKKDIQEAFQAALDTINIKKQEALAAQSAAFDVTISKPGQLQGSLHPYTLITQEIEDIFISMGFEIADGPELETDFANFGALNIPADHPARSESDTFWLPDMQRLLRTHTSTVQIKAMQEKELPIAIACPGRAFRNEATDASHDFMFMQVEGLLIDKNISVSNLLATLKTFLQKLFGKKLELRVRPGFFPFVEPGLEIDASCPFCKDGCSTCKHTKWIELLGSGLVHPNVLKAAGIDPTIYSGFAFGSGLTRLAMLKYNITDIRILHSGDIRFLQQF